MASDKAHNLDGYELYPLNLRDPRFEDEEEDLQRLHSELEKASPSVFVDTSNDCQVDVFEAILTSSKRELIPTTHKDSLDHQKLSSMSISSLREMKSTLKVTVPDSNALQSNVITTEEFATRKYETSVSIRSRPGYLALKTSV